MIKNFEFLYIIDRRGRGGASVFNKLIHNTNWLFYNVNPVSKNILVMQSEVAYDIPPPPSGIFEGILVILMSKPWHGHVFYVRNVVSTFQIFSGRKTLLNEIKFRLIKWRRIQNDTLISEMFFFEMSKKRYLQRSRELWTLVINYLNSLGLKVSQRLVFYFYRITPYFTFV